MKKITQLSVLLTFLFTLFSSTSLLASEAEVPPTLNCPADLVISNDPGVCGAIVDYLSMASAIDPEDGDISMAIITTIGPTNNSLFPIGLTVVELSVTDSEGNTVTCSFSVTVNDTEPPTINCPADMMLNNDPGLCGAEANFTVTGSDNCGGGATAGELTTTFGNNNGQNGIMFDVTASGGEDVSLYEILGHCGPSFGSQMVNIWVMTGSHVGFEANPAPWTLHQTVNVIDNGNTGPGGNMPTPLSPSIVIPAGTTMGIFYETDGTEGMDYTDGTTSYNDAFITVDSGSGKAMGGANAFDGTTFTPRIFNGTFYYTTGTINSTQTAGLPSGSIFPVGVTTNTFEITDPSGNTISCSFDITVADTEPPVANCQNVTVQLDATGNATITAAQVENGSTDNCGVASSSIDTTNFTCNDVGTNNVTLTVTDIYGNTGTCNAVVTVQDVTPPTAVCQDITVQLDASGTVTIAPSSLDGGSTDLCSIGGFAVDIDTFTCADLGPNDVTLIVSDGSGNTSTCTAVVTVEDAVAPTAICQDITVQLDPSGTVTIAPGDVDAGSTDNCGPVTGSLDIDTFTCADIGPNNVTLTVTDNEGNTSSCVAVVTVTETQSPTVVCQDITVALDATGMVVITPADIDNGSSDNCDIASMTLNNDTFTCVNVGIPNNVILTVTDTSGNTSSCNATVTVIDDMPIDAVCQDITVTLDNDGEVTITAADVDGGSSDNCGVSNLSVSQTLFTCADVGPNEVTLTVTNSNGETATCTAVVTVQETILPPTAICQNVTAPLGPDGTVTISPNAVNNDSLGIGCNGTLSLDLDTFTCDDVGDPIPVTLTVMNEDGEIDTCTAFVHVVDSLDPTIECPDTQNVQSAGPYTLPDYFAQGDVIVTDNCENNLTITQTPPPGTVLDAGGYNITMTVTDPSENEAECTFQLYIDNTLGVDNQKDISSLVLYPNPASTYVALANPQGILLKDVTLFDIGGRIIKRVNLEDMGLEQRIDVSGLASATYMVVISSDTGTLVKQFIKE